MENKDITIQPLQKINQDPNIKDHQYIVKQTENNGIVTWVLKTNAKLSEVFNYLPAGIINKTETGIGATTLELDSDRNSIIVEPIKVTASTKAIDTKPGKPERLYIGSPTKSHPDKVTPEKIRDYLNDPTKHPKKILVVADSLPRLFHIIKETNLDFFLMIDEADAFQNEANYRESMEQAMEIYKSFPIDQRALVTATVMPFSDPDLKGETWTTISYLKPTTRAVKLVSTDNVITTAADVLCKLIANFAQDKIVVAFNSVTGCYDLAEHLANTPGIAKNEISILCSDNGKQSVGQYYAQLGGATLPNRLNFMTSAYFSGFDINEKYHLVSISSCDEIKVLSEYKLKQIAGRCRPGLLSEQ